MTGEHEHVELGWFAQCVIRLIAPPGFEESFAGDLVEEANSRVLPQHGARVARRWITIQIARSAPRFLIMPLRERGHFGPIRLAAISACIGTTTLLVSMLERIPAPSFFSKHFAAGAEYALSGIGGREVPLLVAHGLWVIAIIFGARTRVARALVLLAILLGPWGGA